MASNTLLGRPLRIPPTATTLDGFRAWLLSPTFPKRGRVSFLGGEIEVDMSPEDVLSHNDPKSAIALALGILNEADNIGRLQTDGARLSNAAAQVSNVPDLILIRRESMRSGRVAIRTSRSGKRSFSEIVGSPDLVVEVLSHSSIHKDKKVLPVKYFDAGITEYWLVDCRSDVGIEFQMLQRRADGYAPAIADSDGFYSSSAIAYRFRLTRSRDEFGYWKYRLEHRPTNPQQLSAREELSPQ